LYGERLPVAVAFRLARDYLAAASNPFDGAKVWAATPAAVKARARPTALSRKVYA
jgi:hypothetical protein